MRPALRSLLALSLVLLPPGVWAATPDAPPATPPAPTNAPAAPADAPPAPADAPPAAAPPAVDSPPAAAPLPKPAAVPAAVPAPAVAPHAAAETAPPPPPDRAGSGRQVLTFGIQPQWTRGQMERMFRPLMTYLSEQTGYEFRLRVTEDYGALLDEMGSGTVDVGKFSPYGYVMAHRATGMKLFATEVTNGQPYYYGYIVVRKDSHIRSLADLKGKTFSYTDPNSTSGFIYPRAALVEQGQDPNTYFKQVFFAGSHDVCIRGVAAGKTDACATWDVALEDEGDSALFGVNRDELAIIHKTERIPGDAYASRPGLDPRITASIQKALLDLSKDRKKLREVIDWKTRIDGFVPGDDSVYEVVRAKVALKDLKPILAVLPFDKRGVGFQTENPGQLTAEFIGSKLFDSQRFLVVDRLKVEAAVKAQGLGAEALLSPAAAAEAGRALGASVLLSGSVMMLDGKVHITCRLVEAETGRVLTAQHGRGAGLEQAIDDVVAQITAGYEVKGFVLKVRGTDNVTVDLGASQGVGPGVPLLVYKQGETLVHPVTGKVLGTEELVLGEVLTVRTTPELSFGKVVSASELVQQGFRVRTLRQGEVSHAGDAAVVIDSYVDEERTKYEPWLNKYAWRAAALATIPAAWALLKGDDQDKLIFGGVALGLWGLAGGTALYYSVESDSRRVPGYLKAPGATHTVGAKGSF